MKTLKDYDCELSKCSKCGLCESVCPLFKIIPNDCVASKGKFLMLYGVTKGELQMSKKINSYIDMCLKCGKCKNFCPAGIDVCEILAVAKNEYIKNTFIGKITKILQSKQIFGYIVSLGAKLSKPYRTKVKNSPNTLSVMYFKGCVNRILPQTDKYLAKIFKNHAINIIEPDFDCCGLPFLSEGNLERFEEALKCNTDLINGHSYDYMVTDCASCGSTLASYSQYTNNDFQLKNNVNWGEIIAKENIKFNFKQKITVTFHKPCHLENDEFFEKIISNCTNVEYVKMKDYDTCCGLAGSFSLKNPELSKELVKQKAEKIKETNANYVITTCPACLAGLRQGLAGSKIKVVSLLEFLARGK